MTWGAPAFLWSALVMIPLVAVYFIKTRPRRQLVNTFFLWERVLDQQTARSLFQRLRNLLSLLLLALAFLGAVFFLARPSFRERDERDLLIVLDRSASMSGGGESSRLELAKERAASWIAGLGGSQRAAVATVDSQLNYLVHLTDKAKPLREAIASVEESDLPLEPGVLEELALLASDEEAPVRVLWLTDGRNDGAGLPEGVEQILIGDPADNFALTAADLSWQSQNEVRLFVTVSSTSEEEAEVELELVQPQTSQVARLFSVKVPGGGEASESLTIEGLEPGPWELRLVGQDDLAADDVVSLGLNLPRATPIRVVSQTPFFFEQVVQAFARSDSLFELVASEAGVVLAQGAAPDAETALIFQPQGDSPFWTGAGDELAPAVPEIELEDHPLVARFDPALITFAGARVLEAPEGAVVVLTHPDGAPLLYSVQKEGRKAVVVNLDPARGNFFLSPWFPVLVHDAVLLLTGNERRLPAVVPTGTRVEVPGSGVVDEVVRTSGETTEELPDRSPVAAEKRGLYRVSRGPFVSYFGAGLLAPAESGGGSEASSSEAVIEPRRGWPLALWLLLIAVVVIAVEEVLYQRRKVG